MRSSEAFRLHMAGASEADPATAALVEEACRIIERLDKIHDMEAGKSDWIELLHFRVSPDDTQAVHVHIDAVVSEARQQALALKAIMTHLGVGKADISGNQKAVDPIDEIAKRRADRAASAAKRSVRAKRSV